MKYRKIGKRGVRLSCVGLGSYLTIGHKCDDATSKEIVKLAYVNGINFFDTANIYGNGKSEEVLGRCLKDYSRSSLFVLSKVFAPMGTGPNDKGLSAKHIFEQCHASLKRLGMDYLDLYMCHRPDPDTPIDETIRAIEDLTRQGKILYWGVSEWSAEQIMEAQAVAKDVAARPMILTQPRYNLLYRSPEQELFPTTRKEGLGNVIFSPLAQGMLTGKYKPEETALKGSRAADPEQNIVIKQMYWEEEYKRKSQELIKIAEKIDASAAQVAIAWCLRSSDVTSVILGTRTAEQLQENLKAVDIKIPDDIAAGIEKLFPYQPYQGTKF
jgi:voltage-dependent potassium channel beta subunit